MNDQKPNAVWRVNSPSDPRWYQSDDCCVNLIEAQVDGFFPPEIFNHIRTKTAELGEAPSDLEYGWVPHK